MRNKHMVTNEQYKDVVRKSEVNVLSKLYLEIEKEYDPEVIKARIRAKIMEDSPDTNQN